MIKNNKGFTLVELVAVVAIMLALATIATIAVTGTLKKSKGQISEIQYKIIQEAAKAYCIDKNISGECSITANELIETGYLEDNSDFSSIKDDIITIHDDESISTGE